jgi:hypothetical protein
MVYILSVVFANAKPSIQDIKGICLALFGSPGGEFTGYIYVLNFPDTRKYCGQTVNFHTRMCQHKTAHKQTKRLQDAIAKQPFSELTIGHVEVPLCAMDPMEIFIIQHYDLTNPVNGLNGTTGGKLGYTRSADTRRIHSVSMMGNKNPLGTKRSAETIAKYMVGEKNPMYGRRGKLAPNSRRIIAFGNAYECAKEAGVALARHVGLKPECVGMWANTKRYANEMFYITEKFYECAVANEVKHITKDFYEYIIDNGITYFTNDTYKIWSTFEKFCIPTEIPLRKPKVTKRHHTAKPVVAFGIPYTTGQLAAEALREEHKQNNNKFISFWISHGRYPNDVFKITPEFYDYVVDNKITNITKQMYEEYLAGNAAS